MPQLSIVRNCSQLVTCRQDDNRPKRGDDFRRLELIEHGAMVISDELIEWVGVEKDLEFEWGADAFHQVIDAGGNLVTPGLVDPHTHPVFAATREEEFYLRNAGKSYMEIAAAGGGIRNSVRRLRETSADDLYKNGLKYLDLMLRSGTTTLEGKSGYGLSVDAEIKSLEVIKQLNDNHPIDIVPTFLGAHEFPDEFRDDREGYVRLLTDKMIPEVASRKLARFCDIFTEKGVFEVDQSRRILTAAREHGLALKLHADELSSIGGAELAAEMGAVSADHLMHISDRGIRMLSESETVAVLLPATTFFLGHKEYAPARKMIDSGVAMALATDFNPGSSFTTSLQPVMTIAAIYLKMTPEEIVNAVTYNSACSIEMQQRVGSLQPGKPADFAIWKVDSYRKIPYYFAQNMVQSVYKRGMKVV